MNKKDSIGDWINSHYQLDLDGAISLAIAVFSKSIEQGCVSSYYYLSELYRELYVQCSRLTEGESCLKTLTPRHAERYHNLMIVNRKAALDKGEPHALYEEACCYDKQLARHDKSESLLMLERAANAGYPPAVYEYAKRVAKTDRQKALLLTDSVMWCEEVRKMKSFDDEIEAEIRREQLEDEFYEEPTPTLADVFDDPSEVELNTRGDGFD